ncbi:MAG TPA: BamA/TamA family outer membrane protein [Abditibacterium sp.]|jgi:outer membrane protein insertion porin family
MIESVAPLSTLRPRARFSSRLMPVFLGFGAAISISAATAAPKSPLQIAQNQDTPTPRTQGDANAPAAAPQEKPRGLEIPVGPETTPPAGAAATPPADATAPATVPVAPTPRVTPDVPPIIGNVAEAEGREIADVRVVGNRVLPAETILGQVRTQRGAAFSARQAELDRGRVDQLGFFATVQSQVAPDVEQPGKVIVTFIVVENRVVTSYRFNNATALKSVDLVPVLTSKIGQVLNRNNVNQDVAAIQKLYSDRGFAVLVQSAELDEGGTLVFTLQEARISRIEISGLKKTRPELIRRQVRVKNGDPFDASKLRRDLNRIFDLGFFEDATFKVDDDTNLPGSVIVTYLLKEKRTGQLSFGVGFDSRSRISGFATVQETNLRGKGLRALASLETGSRRNFELSFGNPFIGDKNASYDVSVYNRTIFREPRLVRQLTNGNTTDAVSFEEQRTGGRFNFTKPLDYDRNRTLLFGYRNERAKLLQRDSNGVVGPPVTADGNQLQSSGKISAFSGGFLRDMRDLRLDPSRGSRQQLIVEQGISALGGDTTFTKIDLDLRQYFPLIQGLKATDQPRLVFAARFVGGRSLKQLPAFEQYYIGGSDTVRGYDTDEQFGDNQFYTNLELRYRLQNKIQVVGFVDAGTAFGGSFSSNTGSNTLFSYGGGLRVNTPIGPIRLDIGKGDRGVQTHFAIGPTF